MSEGPVENVGISHERHEVSSENSRPLMRHIRSIQRPAVLTRIQDNVVNQLSSVRAKLTRFSGRSRLRSEASVGQKSTYYEPQPNNLPETVDIPSKGLKSLITEDPQALAKILTKLKLRDTGEAGSFFSLYTAIVPDESSPELAVK